MKWISGSCLFVCIALIAGCAAKPAKPQAAPVVAARTVAWPPSEPIVYRRTGGIAQTDDRLVLWPDGFIEVHGKLLGDGGGWMDSGQFNQLRSIIPYWHAYRAAYPTSQPVADAYSITIWYQGKAVTISDLAPDLPLSFRKLIDILETAGSRAVAAGPVPGPGR